MTYKEALTAEMNKLALDPKTIFIGYNTRYGHQFNGTLKNIHHSQLLEMPVAENLIMGMAIGMALEGYHVMVLIERMDFLWVCADAIVNHLDKAAKLGWPPLKIIIRTCVGSSSPLNPGAQHVGNYSEVMKLLLKEITVIECKTIRSITKAYTLKRDGPIMIIEYRKLYEAKS